MKSRRWLPLVAGAGALLGLAAPCLAQHASNWRAYRAADGLPETPVASITIGPHGRLWVRHPYVEWVGRLNGYDITAIPAPSLGTSRVYESAAGQIWTFSLDGLQRYDKESGWTRYNIPEVTAELRTNALAIRNFSLYPLRQNHVLLLLPDGLIECDVDTPAQPQITWLRKAAETKLQKFLGLAAARDGGLWISGIGGLAKVPGPIRNLKADARWDEFLPPEDLQIQNLREPIEDPEGVTMIAESQTATHQIIAHFDGQRWSVRETDGEKITQAWRGPDKTWWAMTPSSLLNIKPGTNQFVPDETIPARRFLDVAVETNGVFWLATSDGLFRYAPLCWQIVADAPHANSGVNGFTEDRDDRLWVASANGLDLFQNEHWTDFAFPQNWSVNGRETRNVFALTNGTIACTAGDRLLQFVPASGTFVEVTNSSQIKPLGMLKDGTLCVQTSGLDASGTRTSRLEIFDGSNFKAPPFPQPELGSGSEAQLLFAAPSGNIWLTASSGIFLFHDKKWQTFSLTTQPASAGLACMLEISDSKLWCGVEDRIWEFDGKTWTLIRAGFDHVNSLVKTADGSIWVASDNGIHRFYHGTWTVNGAEEGLPAGTPVRTIYEDRRGRIWAGTTRDLCLYHPDADSDPPKTYVQNLPERNNTVQEGAIVSVSFSGQDKWKYTAEDRLVYSYRLDGQDWSPFQEQRTVSFLDLPAGKHSFFVRSMDRNWNVDTKPAVLEFAIALPWYRETRLLLISSAGFAVALFFAGLAFNRHRQLVRSYAEVEAKVALRTKQLEIANQELFHSQKMNALGTLAAGIAHDFNNILSIIKGSAQIIDDNLENPDKIRTRTDRIKTVVEQGAGIVKAMLGFSRTTDHQMTLCNVNDIINETIKLLGDRFLREVEVQFLPSPALPEIPASKDFVQQILLNFIFNAADAMTERRHIILSAKESKDLPASMALKPLNAPSYVFVSVKDFGSGISQEVMPRIFEPFFTTKAFSTRRGTGLGLSMVYELARQMECGLSVESKLGEGSTFALIFPVRDLPMDEPEKNR